MTSLAQSTVPRVDDQEFIDRVIAEEGGRAGALLGILARVQEGHAHKFLPLDTLEYIAHRTGIPQAQIYSVATFYALFNLEPQGAHTVCICRGTACHTRGSRTLLERLKLEMGFAQTATEEAGSADKLTFTTADRQFTIRTVACFGQCALAPVAEVDHAILGHVNEHALLREVENLGKERR